MAHDRTKHDRTKDESGVATLTLVAIAGVVLTACAGAAYVATDGFGRNADPMPAAAASEPSSAATVVGERPEDAATQEPSSSSMDAAFAAGESVVCTYTHEAYDATTTLKSREDFRIDQQTQGGPAHVVRGQERTYVWIDGMSEAMEFDTGTFEGLSAGTYPAFDPDEFDREDLFADGTCKAVGPADESLFTLPNGMTSTPGN